MKVINAKKIETNKSVKESEFDSSLESEEKKLSEEFKNKKTKKSKNRSDSQVINPLNQMHYSHRDSGGSSSKETKIEFSIKSLKTPLEPQKSTDISGVYQAASNKALLDKTKKAIALLGQDSNENNMNGSKIIEKGKQVIEQSISLFSQSQTTMAGTSATKQTTLVSGNEAKDTLSTETNIIDKTVLPADGNRATLNNLKQFVANDHGVSDTKITIKPIAQGLPATSKSLIGSSQSSEVIATQNLTSVGTNTVKKTEKNVSLNQGKVGSTTLVGTKGAAVTRSSQPAKIQSADSGTLQQVITPAKNSKGNPILSFSVTKHLSKNQTQNLKQMKMTNMFSLVTEKGNTKNSFLPQPVTDNSSVKKLTNVYIPFEGGSNLTLNQASPEQTVINLPFTSTNMVNITLVENKNFVPIFVGFSYQTRLSEEIFYQYPRINKYRVFFKNKTYVFKFEDNEITDFLEEDYDSP